MRGMPPQASYHSFNPQVLPRLHAFPSHVFYFEVRFHLPVSKRISLAIINIFRIPHVNLAVLETVFCLRFENPHSGGNILLITSTFANWCKFISIWLHCLIHLHHLFLGSVFSSLMTIMHTAISVRCCWGVPFNSWGWYPSYSFVALYNPVSYVEQTVATLI